MAAGHFNGTTLTQPLADCSHLLVEQALRVRFDDQSQQGFGIGLAQAEPPLGEVDPNAVDGVDLPIREHFIGFR